MSDLLPTAFEEDPTQKLMDSVELIIAKEGVRVETEKAFSHAQEETDKAVAVALAVGATCITTGTGVYIYANQEWADEVIEASGVGLGVLGLAAILL